MNQQDELGARIARLLDESPKELSPEAEERLRAARRLALSRRKTGAAEPAFVPVLAGGIANFTERSVLGVRYLIPLAVLVLGLLGVVYVHTGTVSSEIADIDALLLTDELPISAYLDQDFDSWLKRSLR